MKYIQNIEIRLERIRRNDHTKSKKSLWMLVQRIKFERVQRAKLIEIKNKSRLSNDCLPCQKTKKPTKSAMIVVGMCE